MIPKAVEMSRSEDTEVYGKIDVSKFKLPSTTSTIHVDNSDYRSINPILLPTNDKPLHNKRAKKVNRNSLFTETLEKAIRLAAIFKGKVISQNQFSICKGRFSIRFNC
jgi:hypothetical protein